MSLKVLTAENICVTLTDLTDWSLFTKQLTLQPVFTVEPSDVEIEEGHHLILECHALSFPVATYQWFKLNQARAGLVNTIIRLEQ